MLTLERVTPAVTTAGATMPDRSAAGMWLFSEARDFWLVCAGGGVLVAVLVLVLYWCGDRELSAADLLLAELHLGATYGAIARGRLWRSMPLDVVVASFAILAVTYAVIWAGHAILITTAAVYLAAWHRGRQNLGIARYYQIRTGGELSPWHGRLFRAAIYLPMAAGVAFFTSTAPLHEGEQYIRLGLAPGALWLLGALAAASLAAYLLYTVRCRGRVHPGERWLVLANALAFGSAYVLGAWTVSFILVLALHHEIQYLCFTYAMARRSDATAKRSSELRLLASFAVWPVIGVASWTACEFSGLQWLTPLLIGGLLCHYWLDSRIWTAQARRLAAR